MKIWAVRALILIGYSIPYVFLSMNGDATSGTMVFYAFMILAFGLLSFFSFKINSINLVFIGNLMSALSSYFFILHYQTEKWGWYFKPFTANTLFVVTSVLVLFLQALFVFKLRPKPN